jgi:FkbM family methyltransferase
MTREVSYSFEGQDRLAASILRNVDPAIGRYVDVGCHEPVLNSNSYLFYENWNLGGVVIDVQDQFMSAFKAIRPRDTFINCAVGTRVEPVEVSHFKDSTLTTTSLSQAEEYVGKGREVVRTSRIPSVGLTSIIKEQQLDRIDACFIDVEGSEFDVLQSLDFSYVRPALFVLEDKFVAPDGVSSCSEFLFGAGYGLVAKTLLDSFFIDLKNPLFSWIPEKIVRKGRVSRR